MGLCAGFAVADFKPICGGKIGLVYHPSFIVHILFVNPRDYIFSCCRHSFLSCFPLFLPTQMHTNRRKQKWLLQWESNTAVDTGTVTVGYKTPTTVSTQTKGPLFTQKAMAAEQLEKDHMVQKTGDNHAVTSYHKILLFLSLSLLTHTQSIWSVAHQFRTRGVGVSRQQITSVENMGNQFGFLFMEWKRYRLSRMIVAVPTVITCVFLYSKYTLAYSICNHPTSSTALTLLNLKHSRNGFQDSSGK